MTRDPSVFVHPSALCESEFIGPGTRVWAFAHVLPGAVIGADCNICDHVFIEGAARVGSQVTVKNAVLLWDGVTLEDGVFIGPNATFTNDLAPRSKQPYASGTFVPTVVRQGASVGANATIVCGVTIGRNALVGAGSVVSRDVPAHAMVLGNPARQRGWVCQCGGRLDALLMCRCGRRYHEAQAGSGLEEAGPG